MSKLPTTVRTHADADAILQARAGISFRTAVRRISATLAKATPSDVAAGLTWYGDAGNTVQAIADATGLTRGHAAAIIAQLSPRTTWQRNKSAAWHVASGQDGNPVGAMSANVARARVAMAQRDGARALATVKGPKVASFARNILGDTDAVTIDVWAARVALAPNWQRGAAKAEFERTLGRAGVYDALAMAYRAAARAAGLEPSAAQAIAWVVVRNGRAD